MRITTVLILLLIFILSINIVSAQEDTRIYNWDNIREACGPDKYAGVAPDDGNCFPDTCENLYTGDSSILSYKCIPIILDNFGNVEKKEIACEVKNPCESSCWDGDFNIETFESTSVKAFCSECGLGGTQSTCEGDTRVQYVCADGNWKESDKEDCTVVKSFNVDSSGNIVVDEYEGFAEVIGYCQQNYYTKEGNLIDDPVEGEYDSTISNCYSTSGDVPTSIIPMEVKTDCKPKFNASYDSNTDLTDLVDDTGRLLKANILGTNYQFEYGFVNGNNSLIEVKGSLGNEIKYEFNRYGGLISIKDNRGRVYKISRDQSNRITKISAPDGTENQWVYDSNGNVVKQIDPAGGEWHMNYDSNGDLLDFVDPAGLQKIILRDSKNRIVGSSANGIGLGATIPDSFRFVPEFPDNDYELVNYLIENPGEFNLGLNYEKRSIEIIEPPLILIGKNPNKGEISQKLWEESVEAYMIGYKGNNVRAGLLYKTIVASNSEDSDSIINNIKQKYPSFSEELDTYLSKEPFLSVIINNNLDLPSTVTHNTKGGSITHDINTGEYVSGDKSLKNEYNYDLRGFPSDSFSSSEMSNGILPNPISYESSSTNRIRYDEKGYYRLVRDTQGRPIAKEYISQTKGEELSEQQYLNLGANKLALLEDGFPMAIYMKEGEELTFSQKECRVSTLFNGEVRGSNDLIDIKEAEEKVFAEIISDQLMKRKLSEEAGTIIFPRDYISNNLGELSRNVFENA